MNQYTVSPEVLRSLKAGLPPTAAPPSRRLSLEERTSRAREKLTASVRAFQNWRRGQGELFPLGCGNHAGPPRVRLGKQNAHFCYIALDGLANAKTPTGGPASPHRFFSQRPKR